jgi:general stress protein YciG
VAPPLQPFRSELGARKGGHWSGLWQEVSVDKEDRGFASMDRTKQREIASKGGKAAHQKGTAHEWTSEEAREAGRKGGMASHRRRKELGDQGSEMTGNLSSPESSSLTDDDTGSEQIR